MPPAKNTVVRVAPASTLSPHQQEESQLASPSSEEMVLGAMLSGDMKATETGVFRLRPPNYTSKRRRLVHDAITRLWLAQSADGGIGIAVIEPRIVVEELKRAGQANIVGGLDYLQRLTNDCPSSANIDYYIERVLDYSKRRFLIHAMKALERACYEPGAGHRLNEIMDETLNRISDIRQKGYF